MRTLAWAALPYAAAVFLAEYLLPYRGLPFFAAAFFLLAWVGLLFHGNTRRRIMLVCLAAAVGFGWYAVHWSKNVAPCKALEGERISTQARVVDYPLVTDSYARVEVRLMDAALPSVRAALYLYNAELPALEPGDIISAELRVAEETDRFAAKDIYLRGYMQEPPEVMGRWSYAWLYFPQHLCRAIKNACERVFPAFASPLVKGMMTGDIQSLRDEQEVYAAMQSCGVTHVVAVSGLHMLYLVSLVQLLLGRSRLSSLLCLPLILLFVLLTGCTPSVVRAAVLQVMMLLAPLFEREADGLTDLSAALFLLLLVNPSAAGSISLQLSFAAAGGMLAVNEPLRRWANDRVHGHLGRWVADSLICTVGASVFSMPLAAVYFGYVPLMSALVNLLCLPLLEIVFCAGYLFSVMGLVLPSVAAVLAWPPAALVWVCELIFRTVAALPFACAYTESAAVIVWLVFLYGSFGLSFFLRRRGKQARYIIPAALSVSSLCVILVMSVVLARGQAGVAVLDVGQGECVALYDGGATVLVDCGGTGTSENAGSTAAAFVRAKGRTAVDLLILTHLHADHANGVSELLYRIPVRRLAFSEESMDDDRMLSDILQAAETTGTEVLPLSGENELLVGAIQLELYQPLSGEDENERGLVVAADIRGTEVLVMGDMDADGEQTLVGDGRANTDILVAGHHGSKYSSSALFLTVASPEWTVVSVGKNSYGHPTEEAMERIYDASENVRRTDADGTVTIRIR